jgi:hypothetical protein
MLPHADNANGKTLNIFHLGDVCEALRPEDGLCDSGSVQPCPVILWLDKPMSMLEG